MNEKQCPKCKLTLSVDLFQKNRSAKDGLQYQCTSCRKLIEKSPIKLARDRKRYHDNKGIYRDKYYQRTYGLTIDQYNSLLASQGNKCAVCKGNCKTGRLLAVDHDHNSGSVRGLLCSSCNQALGLLQDDSEIISNLLKYINKYG